MSPMVIPDEAMLRRFQMKVDFRLPNREERHAIIGHYLDQRAAKLDEGMDLRHLVEITEGRSPADLETIVNQAGIIAVQAGDNIGESTLMQAADAPEHAAAKDAVTRAVAVLVEVDPGEPLPPADEREVADR